MDELNPHRGVLVEFPRIQWKASGGASGSHGAPTSLQVSGGSAASNGVLDSPVSVTSAPLVLTGTPSVCLAALPGPPGPVVSGKTSYTALPVGHDNLTAEKEAYRELRRRARAACRICGLRKVRCDVTKQAFGEPCTNCRRDGLTCTVLPRKKHRPRRPNGTFDYGPASVSPLDANAAGREDDAFNGLDGPDSPDSPDPGAGIKAPSPEVDGRLPDDDVSTYMGDNRGPRQSVYDLCHPLTPQEARPHRTAQTPNSEAKGRAKNSSKTGYINAPTSSAWSRHEAAYLNHQGAFTPLYSRLLDDIFRVYFAHVHFFLPVVDASEFIDCYKRSGWNTIHPLLGWSMCLAAANFVPDDVLSRAGFKTRKEMKEAMYARAKSLYDLDKATDKVTLIQSVLLIGFWYTDAHDHTGAWHWIGVAISLAQSLGFHRRPQLRHPPTSKPTQDQVGRDRTARRIWWTCLVRDRWVSLAKGRPMRIHDEDCDVPTPLQDDLMQGYDAAYKTWPGNNILLPPNQAIALSSMWLRLVTISGLLGRIVRSHYRVQGPRPTQHEIECYEREIQLCRPQEDDDEGYLHGGHEDTAHKHILLHKKHADLFYFATVAILYRPYLLQAKSSLPSNTTPQWHKTAASRARAAAASTNDVLNHLIELQAVHLLKPMTITAFVPAMQIHLFDCKSDGTLLRNHGKNKLDLCLLVLSEMRNTYWSASVIFRLFTKAQQILEGSSSRSAGLRSAAEPAVANVESTALSDKAKLKKVAVAAGPTSSHSQIGGRPYQQQQQQPLQSPPESQHFHGPLQANVAPNSDYHTQQALNSNVGHSPDNSHRAGSNNNYMANVITPTAPPPYQGLAEQPLPPDYHSSGQYHRPTHPQQQEYTSYHQTPDTHPEGVHMEAVPASSNWWDQPQNCRDVDQLLSPGFSLSDDIVQGLFQNFNEDILGPDIDMLYLHGQSQE